MGRVKRLELWWQLYRTSLPVWDLENFRPMDFCWHECTRNNEKIVKLVNGHIHRTLRSYYQGTGHVARVREMRSGYRISWETLKGRFSGKWAENVIYVFLSTQWMHIVALILNVNARWTWVVHFTHRPLHPRQKSRRHPLYRSVGGPQSNCGRFREKYNYLPMPGIEPRLLFRPARSLYTILNELSRLTREKLGYSDLS